MNIELNNDLIIHLLILLLEKAKFILCLPVDCFDTIACN